MTLPPDKKLTAYIYGEIPNVPPGTRFASRRELYESGVHRPPMGGISGSSTNAAESIVVSGGYEDDEDSGDEIVYTGQGGNDPQTGRQIEDQKLVRGNRGLVIAELDAVPVRVIRGARSGSSQAPTSGYRYDGLFRVVAHWDEVGRSGFRIYRFRLRRIEGESRV